MMRNLVVVFGVVCEGGLRGQPAPMSGLGKPLATYRL